MKKSKDNLVKDGVTEGNTVKFKKPKNPEKRKWIISLATFIVGILVVIAGVICLILNLSQSSVAKDAEYLIATDGWVLEDSDRVVWNFTEIGKGKLTTNAHENDYDFKWAIEDGKLKIETDWLYELDNEYEYSLDQGNGVLTLTDDDESYRFVAQ